MFFRRPLVGLIQNEFRLGWVFVCLLLTTFSFASRLNAGSVDDQLQIGQPALVATIVLDSVEQGSRYSFKSPPNRMADCGLISLLFGCYCVVCWQVANLLAASIQGVPPSLTDLGIRLQI